MPYAQKGIHRNKRAKKKNKKNLHTNFFNIIKAKRLNVFLIFLPNIVILTFSLLNSY